jgi:hypothetical protein
MKRSILALPVFALVACGSSHPSSGTTQTFDATAQAISSAAANYRSSAATMADASACAAAESAYDAQVRPLVNRMHDLAGGMDAQMTSMMGQAGSADMSCAGDAMTTELDRHHAVACASPADMLPNEAEADHHARWMMAWADHQRARVAQMSSGSMGMMGSGMAPIGTCEHAPDGSFTMMGGATMQMPGMGVQGVHSLAQDVGAAVTAYGAAAAGMTDVPSCTTAESAYDAKVRPMVQQMSALAVDMDGMMSSLGQPAQADMACASDAMLAELDHHRAIACGAEVSADLAEAARHVQAMTSWADHQRIRSEAMGSMMNVGGMTSSGGTTGTCQQLADGSFAMK